MNQEDIRKFCVELICRHRAYDKIEEIVRDGRILEDFILNGSKCALIQQWEKNPGEAPRKLA